MKKRLLSIALCLCMVLTLLPTMALAVTDYPGGWNSSQTYSDGDTITIDDKSYTYQGDVSSSAALPLTQEVASSDLGAYQPLTGDLVWKAGAGYILYSHEAGSTTAAVTLHAATAKGITLPCSKAGGSDGAYTGCATTITLERDSALSGSLVHQAGTTTLTGSGRLSLTPQSAAASPCSLSDAVTVTGGATVTLNNGMGYFSGSLTVDSDSRLVNNSTIVMNSGVTTDSHITGDITGSGVVWFGDSSTPYIKAGDEWAVYGGDVSNTGLNLDTATGVTLPAENTAYKAGDGYALWEPLTDREEPANVTGGTLTFQDASIEVTKNEVGDMNATAVKLPALTSGVNVVFEGTNNITVNNMSEAFAFSCNGGANFTLANGSNTTLTEKNGNASTQNAYGIYAVGSTTVTGSGKLTVNANGTNSYAIATTNKISLTGGTLDLTGLVGVDSAVTLGDITVPAGSTLNLSGATGVTQTAGTSVTNNGTLILPAGTTDQQVNALNRTGTGAVRVGNKVYLNDGTVQIYRTTPLDFTASAAAGNWSATATEAADGYSWNSETNTLTLNNLYLTGNLTLPLEATIVTNGASTVNRINMLNPGTQKLTFSGTAPLTANGLIGSSQNTELTVNAGAELNAKGGISIGTSSGLNGLLKVNGKLTASSASGSAINCGKVIIGSTGELAVTGEGGVKVNGMDPNGDGVDYTGAFTIENGGKFTGNCTKANVTVFTGTTELADANQVIVLPEDYLPEGYAVRVVSAEGKYAATIAKSDASLTLDSENITGAGGESLTITEQSTGDNNGDNGNNGNNGNSGGGSGTSIHTLRFETNGADAITKLIKSYGTTIDLTAYNPTKAGCLFDGWYTDPELTEKVTSIKLTKNTTVYAKWTEKTAGLLFTDVPADAWYYEDLVYVYNNNLFAGTSDTTFSPSANMTRQQMWMVLARIAGETPANMEQAQAWAMENGVSDGSFPTNNVTREQFVTLLWRFVGSPVSTYDMSGYTDFDAVADYAKEAMRWAVENGIVSGTTATTLSPQNNATRAQVAVILSRYLRK